MIGAQEEGVHSLLFRVGMLYRTSMASNTDIEFKKANRIVATIA